MRQPAVYERPLIVRYVLTPRPLCTHGQFQYTCARPFARAGDVIHPRKCLQSSSEMQSLNTLVDTFPKKLNLFSVRPRGRVKRISAMRPFKMAWDEQRGVELVHCTRHGRVQDVLSKTI